MTTTKIYKPKDDFERTVNIQKQYVQLLKEFHAQLMIQRSKGNAFSKSKMGVELFELSQKLDTQIEISVEKEQHYHNIFLPNYNEQLKDCESNFDKLFSQATVSSNQLSNDIGDKMKIAIDSYNELDDDNKNHIELKNVVFQDLKYLISL